MSRDPIVAGLPPAALVLLIGPAGAGKSTWARSRFDGAEILSSDVLREQVAADAVDQSANADTFKMLHLVAAARLRRGLGRLAGEGYEAIHVLHDGDLRAV